MSNHRAYTSPSHFLALIAASVFIAEALVMILLFILPPLHYAITAPLDALLTTILVYPMLRRFVVRPMTQYIDERRQAEAALSRAYDELELRVRERTAELAQANESLQIEIAGHRRAREELQVALGVAQQRQAEVVGLLKGARAVLEYRDFKELAQAILKVCKEVIGATAGYVALPSEDRANETIVFLDFENSAHVIERGLQMPTRGLRAQVYSTGKAVCVNDYAGSEWAETPLEGHVGLHNIILAPMVIKGFVVGVVCLADKPDGFSDNDVRMASAFAELAAIALLNSQTLELLEASEKRFRTLAQTTFEGIAITENGIIREVNEQFVHTYGYKLSDVIGRPITDFLVAELHEQVMRTVVSGEESIGEYRALAKDGSPFLLEAHGCMIEQGGRLMRITAMRDITERKRAEEALRESEGRFRLALKNAPVSVTAQDRDLRFLWAYNQRTVDLGAVIGKTDTDLFPPEDAARLIALKRKVLETETEAREQFWLTSGGKRVFLDLYVEPMRDAAGQVTGIGIATVDLTQMKLAEEALRESEKRLRALYLSMTEGLANHEVVYANGEAVDYIITEVNPAFERITGLARSEAVGRKASELYGTGRPPYLDVYAKVASGGAPKDFETYFPPMEKHFAISVFSPEKGKFATVFTDITDRKRAEERMAWLASFPELNPNPVMEVDLAGHVEYLNPAAKRLLPDLGTTGQKHPLLAGLESVGQQFQSESKTVIAREVQLDGVVYQQTLFCVPGSRRVRIYNLDISKRKRAEEALRQAHAELELRVQERTAELSHANEALRRSEEALKQSNRALRMLSECSVAQIHAEDEQSLLTEICRLIVETGGYRMAWVGFAEHDQVKSVRPVAQSGVDEGYLDRAQITWADTERGRGPTGTAIRAGVTQVNQDFLTNPRMAPWREAGLMRGYQSSIALPLKDEESTFGALTIYSSSPDAFDAEEAGRLTKLANDLAFGINALRAEAAIRQLSSAVEQTADTVVITDCNGFIEYVNPAFERLTGYTKEEASGKTPRILKSGIHDDQFYKRLWHTVLTGQVFLSEITNRKKNGELYHEVKTITPLRDAQGNITHFVATGKDITERRRAAEQLRLQIAAMEAAANGIVITDRQGNIQWSNPAFTQMSGYAIHEVLGQSTRIFKSGQQDADFYRQMWTAILSGQVWRGEMVNRRKDGSLYVEEQTIAPVLNEQGQIVNFVAVKQDVTERKRAEARLRQNNRDLLALSKAEHDQRQLAETLAAANSALTQSLDLEAVLEALLDHVERLVPYDSANVMLLDAEARLSVRVARGYERWGKAELVRAISFDVRANPILNALLTTRQSSLVSDTHTQPGWETPAGVEHVHSWLGVPLMAGGHVIGLYSLDKTEPGFFTAEHVRKAEMLAGQAAVAIQNAWLFEQVRAGRERLQSLSRRLVEVQEAERQYVARELHDEAGQALTSLVFGLGQIEQQMDNPRQAAHVVELKEMTHGIIESLHRLAMDLRPASLDHLGLVPALLQYVKAVGDRYGLTAQFKAVGLESERLPSEVETALYRIVQEALTNIVRHAQATRVDVLLERRGDRVVVVVEDNGLGFNAEIARFMQEGHLGLVGMQERAEMLGGSLIIESTSGIGTTIVVEVPHGNSYPGR